MIDIILLLLVAASTLFGLMKGFVSTVAGVLAWVLGVWLAFLFGSQAASWWANGAEPGMGHYLAGYGSVFIVVMVGVGAVGLLLRTAIRAALLGGIDRLLGGAIGLFRGLLLACVLLVIAGLTPLTAEPVWQQSQLRPMLQPGVAWMESHLPALAMPRVNLEHPLTLGVGKPGATGDNARAGGWPPGAGQGDQYQLEPSSAPSSAQPEWPPSIEPEPTRAPAPGSP